MRVATGALVAATAVAVTSVPAHAATEEYGISKACRAVLVGPIDGGNEYLVVANATSKSTVSVPMTTMVHCRVYDTSTGATYWSGRVSTAGAAAVAAGDTTAPGLVATCAQGGATFSDGQTIETACE